ncbi:MAG: hypothetical protein ACTSSD_08240 [Candidatus Thorarchaeota archaeon]
MRRLPSKLLLFGFMTLFLVLLIGGYSLQTSTAQNHNHETDPDDFVNDNTLFVYASLDGTNLKETTQGSPIIIDMDDPMVLYLQINVSQSLTQDLNMSGSITFYYQGIAIFPIQIVDYNTNSTWIHIDHSASIPVIESPIGLGDAFQTNGIKLATGIFEASIDFRYYIEGDPVTEHIVSNTFYFEIPAASIVEVITSIAGITAVAATGGAAIGLVNGFRTLFEGLKTAYKLRGLHKKASELRSLPNLTVIGALPLLFSMLAGMAKMGKKKKKDEDDREDSAASEYLIRQRLREVAPDAWQVDKCPKCKRNWNTKLDMCKKCNFTQDDARAHYADLLSSKVTVALKVMGKKKSTDIRTLAKKTKSTDYNAGVIAAAMVDTGVTEIVKVGTPLRSFVMNIAGLVFLVITWQQLLGDSASTLQTTLTLVGAAMSLAIIVALYVSRKTQVQKFQADIDDGKKWMPTEDEEVEVDEEEASEDDVEEDTESSEEEEESQEVAESEEPEDDADFVEVESEEVEADIDEADKPEDDSD